MRVRVRERGSRGEHCPPVPAPYSDSLPSPCLARSPHSHCLSRAADSRVFPPLPDALVLFPPHARARLPPLAPAWRHTKETAGRSFLIPASSYGLVAALCVAFRACSLLLHDSYHLNSPPPLLYLYLSAPTTRLAISYFVYIFRPKLSSWSFVASRSHKNIYASFVYKHFSMSITFLNLTSLSLSLSFVLFLLVSTVPLTPSLRHSFPRVPVSSTSFQKYA